MARYDRNGTLKLNVLQHQRHNSDADLIKASRAPLFLASIAANICQIQLENRVKLWVVVSVVGGTEATHFLMLSRRDARWPMEFWTVSVTSWMVWSFSFRLLRSSLFLSSASSSSSSAEPSLSYSLTKLLVNDRICTDNGMFYKWFVSNLQPNLLNHFNENWLTDGSTFPLKVLSLPLASRDSVTFESESSELLAGFFRIWETFNV